MTNDARVTTLLRIWRDLLESPELAPDSNFFLNGGHSTLVVQMIADVERELGIVMPFDAPFAAPTPILLAAHLGRLDDEEVDQSGSNAELKRSGRLFSPVTEPITTGPRLYVFPFAGATAPSLSPLARDGLAGFSVFCADLPGRMPRLEEPPRVDFAPLVQDLAAELAREPDRRFALLGICGGSYLALETARTLRSWNVPGPAALVTVTAAAPDVVAIPPYGVGALGSEVLWRYLVRQGQVTPELAGNRTFRRLTESAIRGDFELFADYRYERRPPLDEVPIEVVYGGADTEFRRGEALGWHRQTTGPVRVHALPRVGSWPIGEAPEAIGAALRDHL